MSTVSSLFEVPRMTCGGCRSRIEEAVTPLEGVAATAVDVKDKKVTVIYDAELITVNKITKAIEGAGYAVVAARKVA